jgi:hypothetical protein
LGQRVADRCMPGHLFRLRIENIDVERANGRMFCLRLDESRPSPPAPVILASAKTAAIPGFQGLLRMSSHPQRR